MPKCMFNMDVNLIVTWLDFAANWPLDLNRLTSSYDPTIHMPFRIESCFLVSKND